MSRKPPICTIGIRNLVTAFYTRVRRDHVLAPVFARKVGATDADWAAHIASEKDFWSSLTLAGDADRPKPITRRLCLLDLEPALFERWLSLLDGTCADLFEPPVAAALQGYVTSQDYLLEVCLPGEQWKPTRDEAAEAKAALLNSLTAGELPAGDSPQSFTIAYLPIIEERIGSYSLQYFGGYYSWTQGRAVPDRAGEKELLINGLCKGPWLHASPSS